MSNGIGPQPSVEDTMTGGLGEAEGFDLFNDDEMSKIEEINEQMAEEQRQIAKSYARVFSSENGKEVLEDLLSRTLRESVYMPERENPEVLGHIREGQNTLVRYIVQRINQGQELYTSQEGDE